MIPSKRDVHSACIKAIQNKIKSLNSNISDAQKAAAEDTKSSAGDKYETSREMIKQEINKASQQLAIYEKMAEVLMRMKPEEKPSKILLGSLIHTNEGWYYFSISLGQVVVNDTKIYVLSMASPLGSEMFNKIKGAMVEFRGRKIEILEIY